MVKTDSKQVIYTWDGASIVLSKEKIGNQIIINPLHCLLFQYSNEILHTLSNDQNLSRGEDVLE